MAAPIHCITIFCVKILNGLHAQSNFKYSNFRKSRILVKLLVGQFLLNENLHRYIYIFFIVGHGKIYRTGDYGKIVDNVLLYEGRVDSQIKIRGQRVDLSEVQTALNNINVVQKSAVLCYKPGDINQVRKINI